MINFGFGMDDNKRRLKFRKLLQVLPRMLVHQVDIGYDTLRPPDSF